MERHSLEWLNMRSRGLAVLIVVALLMPLIPISNAQNPIFGVQLTCEDLPELDVSPSGYEPIDILCTIENTAAVGATKVEITNEWTGGSKAEMQGATGEYSIDAGGSEEFTVTFSGTTKQASSNSYDFEIFATVTEWNSIPMGEPMPQENDSYVDTLEIASYGAVELDILGGSTETVEAGSEFVIDVQFTNNGNDADNIRVDIVNLNNLKNQGFSFIGSEFVAEQLAAGATSALREIKILAPSDADGDINVDIQFRASSTNDPSAEFSETNIPVTVESSESSGTLTGGISEVGQDDIILYGAIAGGVILLLLLLGVVRRSVKKKKVKQIDLATPIELDSDDDQEVDEFDDLFDDLDDVVIESDEFDDLLDDF
ncbi:MAG: hypothetical protein ISP82_06525 [Candidatus Poseidoniaceae archaeon]|nr:hypothetical protein [Candidatus Poseidoniaceae archaeon]MBL6896598.1 hypothetical protein [Candidatus Poseidoniaceae archaeon]